MVWILLQGDFIFLPVCCSRRRRRHPSSIQYHASSFLCLPSQALAINWAWTAFANERAWMLNYTNSAPPVHLPIHWNCTAVWKKCFVSRFFLSVCVCHFWAYLQGRWSSSASAAAGLLFLLSYFPFSFSRKRGTRKRPRFYSSSSSGKIQSGHALFSFLLCCYFLLLFTVWLLLRRRDFRLVDLKWELWFEVWAADSLEIFRLCVQNRQQQQQRKEDGGEGEEEDQTFFSSDRSTVAAMKWGRHSWRHFGRIKRLQLGPFRSYNSPQFEMF